MHVISFKFIKHSVPRKLTIYFFLRFDIIRFIRLNLKIQKEHFILKYFCHKAKVRIVIKVTLLFCGNKNYLQLLFRLKLYDAASAK